MAYLEHRPIHEDDPHSILFRERRYNGVDITFLGVDHKRSKRPERDPWKTIEKYVRQSSLVMAEYAYPEMPALWGLPVIGQRIKHDSDASGITRFSKQLAYFAAKHEKMIGCADIANRARYEAIYYGGVKFIAPLLAIAGRLTDMRALYDIGFYGSAIELVSLLDERLGSGLFSRKVHEYEKYLVHAEDARRLLTAQGIRKATELYQGVPDAKILYVSPREHTMRVDWYLDLLDHPYVSRKAEAWARMPGLDTNLRIYQYARDQNNWPKIANIPLRS